MTDWNSYSCCCDWGFQAIRSQKKAFPIIDDCTLCPDGAPEFWEFDVAGIANGSCLTCADFNGTHLFSHPSPGCGWRFPETGFQSVCGRSYFWVLFNGPQLSAESGHSPIVGNAWRIRLWFSGAGTLLEGAWIINHFVADPFDCLGPNTFTRYYDNLQVCTNLPATITVVPAEAP